MGLDMYLYREKYLSKEDNKIEITDVKTGKKEEYKSNGSGYGITIKDTIAYWRKANQIHKWFVDNVQDGEDDCGYYYVSRDQLEELLALCKEVKAKSKLVDGKDIEDPSVAEELLPTTDGFFFGNTDYDNYYLDDINLTIEQLEEVLNNKDNEGVDFYYSSSW